MVRRISAILAGLATFSALEFMGMRLATTVWPAFALAAPTHAYTLEMLLVRQAAGMMITLAAGAAAGWVSRGEKQTVLVTGVVMLLIGVILHVRTWDHYPVWYHLLFFSYLIPLAVLGGRLVGQRTMMAEGST